MDDKEKAKKINDYISKRALEGFVVVDKNESDFTCVLSRPAEKVNHLLHFFIALVTLGFWLLIWLIISLAAKSEMRRRAYIDSGGNLVEEKVTV